MTKLLFESLDEFVANKIVKLDEGKFKDKIKTGVKKLKHNVVGPRAIIIDFLKDPVNHEDILKNAFKEQVTKWPNVGVIIDSLDLESKKNLAVKAAKFLKANPGSDSKIMLPLYKNEKGKVAINFKGEITGTGVGSRNKP